MLFSISISQILHRIYMYQNYSSIVINNYLISKLLYAYKIPFNWIFTILSCSLIVNPLLNNLTKMRVALLGATLMQEHGTWWAWVGKIPWRRACQSSLVFLSGESPGIEEPGRTQSMGSQTVRHDWVTKHSTLYMAYLYNSFFWKDSWLA